MAKPVCFKLLLHCIRLAASRAAWIAGNSRPTNKLMMAITTSNSTSVRARAARCFESGDDVLEAEHLIVIVVPPFRAISVASRSRKGLAVRAQQTCPSASGVRQIKVFRRVDHLSCPLSDRNRLARDCRHPVRCHPIRRTQAVSMFHHPKRWRKCRDSHRL